MGAISEDVVGVVARGIYYAFRQPLKDAAPFFDQLPQDARAFLRVQARAGLERLRQNVTDGMIEAALDLESPDPESIFVVMLDAALSEKIN